MSFGIADGFGYGQGNEAGMAGDVFVLELLSFIQTNTVYKLNL